MEQHRKGNHIVSGLLLERWTASSNGIETERAGGPAPMRTFQVRFLAITDPAHRARDMGNKSHKYSMWNEVGSTLMT
jgi:hypothetical protein